MIIKLPPRLTANEIRELAFTKKPDNDEEHKPFTFVSMFTSVLGGQKIPKLETKSSFVEPINLSLKNPGHFSLDYCDSEKPKSLFSYFGGGGSDSK
jgi:hypothetical protein